MTDDELYDDEPDYYCSECGHVGWILDTDESEGLRSILYQCPECKFTWWGEL